MHLLVVILILLIIWWVYREGFISSFNDVIDKALDPIFVNYRGRERDWRGMDYYDHFLEGQLLNENLSANNIRHTM
jgi:hypothetical protein